MIGIILVHLDWPWVAEPEYLREDILPACQNILENIRKDMVNFKGDIATIKTPKMHINHPLPKEVAEIIQELESKTNFQLTTAEYLENAGQNVAKRFPHITRWKIGGFWRDLCCADIKHGVKIQTPAIIPHNWSTYVEIEATQYA